MFKREICRNFIKLHTFVPASINNLTTNPISVCYQIINEKHKILIKSFQRVKQSSFSFQAQLMRWNYFDWFKFTCKCQAFIHLDVLKTIQLMPQICSLSFFVCPQSFLPWHFVYSKPKQCEKLETQSIQVSPFWPFWFFISSSFPMFRTFSNWFTHLKHSYKRVS